MSFPGRYRLFTVFYTIVYHQEKHAGFLPKKAPHYSSEGRICPKFDGSEPIWGFPIHATPKSSTLLWAASANIDTSKGWLPDYQG
jgi:hypothetical protein